MDKRRAKTGESTGEIMAARSQWGGGLMSRSDLGGHKEKSFMRSRVLMLLVALMLPVSLFAQSNAIAVFVNHGTYHSTSATDPSDGVSIEIKFDSKIGYGASYDRFFSPNLSAQFLAQRLRGDTKVVISDGGTSISQNVGALDLNEFDAALHWH